MEEIAVSDVSDGVSAKDVGDVDGESGEIEATSEKARDGHDDVVDERFDDGGKSTTNGDTDGEIDDAAAVDEFAEFFEKAAIFEFMEKGFVHRDIIAQR